MGKGTREVALHCQTVAPTYLLPHSYACQTGIQAFKKGVSLSLMKII